MITMADPFSVDALRVWIEDRVDDWIEKTVEVAEPADDADEQRRVVTSFAAERTDEGEDEERQPAGHERPRYDAERPRCLPLSVLLALLLSASLGQQSL